LIANNVAGPENKIDFDFLENQKSLYFSFQIKNKFDFDFLENQKSLYFTFLNLK
jgi:hypothetical protein